MREPTIYRVTLTGIERAAVLESLRDNREKWEKQAKDAINDDFRPLALQFARVAGQALERVLLADDAERGVQPLPFVAVGSLRDEALRVPGFGGPTA